MITHSIADNQMTFRFALTFPGLEDYRPAVEEWITADRESAESAMAARYPDCDVRLISINGRYVSPDA